jgi:regulator of PEP synthase PpsR (kinase-PPPase family)
MKILHLHLISDSTGETTSLVGRASLAQFEDIRAIEHLWNMVRNEKQVHEALAGIAAQKGFVLYTLVDGEVRKVLEDGCRKLNVPYVPVIDPVVAAMGAHLGEEVTAQSGGQHVMDADYFNRIEAMQFVLAHDDGQATWNLNEADVLILGVSRTSKTPTSVYLANRGIKAANIPIVPGVPVPEELYTADVPLIVGLTNDPRQLVQIRRNRLRMLQQEEETDYVDFGTVSEEVSNARKLYTKNDWPIIDVSRKSIEETAATILQMYNRITGPGS